MRQWKEKHKFEIQVGALIAALAAPFALYAGMTSGMDGLAVGAFAAFAVSMAVVAWAG